MNFIKGIKKLFKMEKHVEFSMQTNTPDIETGSIHEDNMWFHGTKFKVLTVEEVVSHPSEHWKYTIKGTCELLKD